MNHTHHAGNQARRMRQVGVHGDNNIFIACDLDGLGQPVSYRSAEAFIAVVSVHCYWQTTHETYCYIVGPVAAAVIYNDYLITEIVSGKALIDGLQQMLEIRLFVEGWQDDEDPKGWQWRRL
jgi:hypothetical protein